jgi:glutamate--cysteine ligase
MTFEPGGQLEYSAPPARGVSALVRDVRGVLEPLRARVSRDGIDLVALGIDPHRDVADAPLQLRADRYARMDAYFATIGSFGARMMRQTASFQVCLDAEDEGSARWHVLNDAAPYVTAIFANSSRYAGALTTQQSVRAECWRRLDPARTGMIAGERPINAYLAFALAAPDMMRKSASGEYAAFGDWLDAGDASLDDWHHHLSTLFPDVRPRGYFEVRGADAIDAAWCVAPLALLGGIAYDSDAQAEALSLLGGADQEPLERAGTAGLRDARIATTAAQLVEIALRGCDALGPDFLNPGDMEDARDFFARYTLRARSPADDARNLVTSQRHVSAYDARRLMVSTPPENHDLGDEDRENSEEK